MAGETLSLNEQIVAKLMHMMEHTHEVEYSCEETFALLDEYAEMVTDDQEAAALMPLVQRHLDLCPDCCDKFDTLLRILQTESIP
ncbi:MAG: hypothetical protein ACE5E7_07150 [Anaerolineae bacterium]